MTDIIPCYHRRCDLCLQRECHLREKFRQIGDVSICSSCLVRAVRFALYAAQTMGGFIEQERLCGFAPALKVQR